MNNTTRNIIVAVLIILIGIILWFTLGERDAGAISINREACTMEENSTYICPPESLENFGPITVTDNTSGNECTVSFNSSNGFSFEGTNMNMDVPPSDIAVSFLQTGLISNIVTTGSNGSIAMHINESGIPDHVLTVDNNNQTEQCFSSN